MLIYTYGIHNLQVSYIDSLLQNFMLHVQRENKPIIGLCTIQLNVFIIQQQNLTRFDNSLRF